MMLVPSHTQMRGRISPMTPPTIDEEESMLPDEFVQTAKIVSAKLTMAKTRPMTAKPVKIPPKKYS